MKTNSASRAPQKSSPSRPRTTAKPTTNGRASGSIRPAQSNRVAGPTKSSPSQNISRPSPDRVTLSGQRDRPSASFVNPLENMFDAPTGSKETASSGSSARAGGQLSNASYDVGAEAHSTSAKDSVSRNGDTTHRRVENKDAHASIGATGDLSQGRLQSEVDLGASVQHQEGQLTQKETEIGGVRLGVEAGGRVNAGAEAALSSSTDVDLANGRLDHQSRAALGFEVNARGHVASEVEALGVKRRDEASVGMEAKAGFEAERKLKIDENGVDASQGFAAEAKLAADAKASTAYSSEAGSLKGEVRGEASLFAEAHADSHFKLTQDELSFGARGGASAAAQLQAEGTVEAETRNGSSFKLNGGANTGSLGAGAGIEFSRKKGETSLGFESYGGLALVGGHLNGNVTVADRDVAEVAAAPLAVGGMAYNAVGSGAEFVGQGTESLRQSAEERQKFISQMAETPTGNFIADTGISAANVAHGAYTNTVQFADDVVDGTGQAARQVGQAMNTAAVVVADKVEQKVGEALDYGVKKAHSGYQYGRAVGGGFIQGLGQGAYNITSLGGWLY